MNEGAYWFAFIINALIFGTIGYGLAKSTRIPKQEAIERGYAHYVADQKTGIVRFEWKEEP